jgi:HPt (histidine-containing phosphotransfer) domain-containing protein
MADPNPIDPQALETMLQMVGGDTAFLAEMIDAYLVDSPQLLADLRQALNEEDAELLRRAAHSLKSNSENFGAHGLAALARNLEELGKSGSLAEANNLTEQVAAEYERVKRALEVARPTE